MTEQDPTEQPIAGTQSEIARKRRQVLIVEDDPDNRTVCRLILEHGGFEVLQACNGEEGLRRARADLPDLIIMDISIPVMNGWEVTRILKAEEKTRTIPIIVLSAHAFRAHKAEAEKLGCAGFLVKPIAPSMILKAVSRQLEGELEVTPQ